MVLKLRNISAIFFLALFGILCLHNVLPHVHHSHDFDEVALEQHTHGSQDHQHHDDHDPESKGLDDFLLFFLTHHAHIYQVQESIDFVQKERQTVKHDCFKAIELVDVLPLPKPGYHDFHRYCVFEQAHYDNPHLLSNSLRGPPALG